MTKQELRKEIISRLTPLSSADLEVQSKLICSKIIESADYLESTLLLAYMPLGDEVDILPVIKNALENNKKVFLPRIKPGTNQMDFYRYFQSAATTQGSYGILEPQADEAFNLLTFLKNNHASRILVLVPGRAFTKDGKRLGRGKGFYDIYFSRLAEALAANPSPQNFKIKKSGVCFAQQLLPDLPTTPDDVIMDSVVSTSSTTGNITSVR